MPPSSLLATEEGRRRTVEAFLHFTRDTPIAPSAVEQQLLDQFVKGELTLDQVVEQLEAYAPDGA